LVLLLGGIGYAVLYIHGACFLPRANQDEKARMVAFPPGDGSDRGLYLFGPEVFNQGRFSTASV
jgi:hypothetical protein